MVPDHRKNVRVLPTHRERHSNRPTVFLSETHERIQHLRQAAHIAHGVVCLDRRHHRICAPMGDQIWSFGALKKFSKKSRTKVAK